MPTNKHALIRYQALDKCFANTGRRFFIEDLITECNKALYEYTGTDCHIKRRQVFDDINFLESEEGYSIPLCRLHDGKRTYYRYEDSNYSINRQPISRMEAEQLRDTIVMLNRFKGLPHFEWMNEVLVRFESTFHLKENVDNAVSFEENPDLVGLSYFTMLFGAIINKQVLQITYHRFGKPIQLVEFHPYQLRRYNSRWFLIGYNPIWGEKHPITNLALDRMENIDILSHKSFHPNTIDLDDYYYDVIGVTVLPDAKKEKILLRIYYPTAYYVLTKPFHASQKLKEKTDDYIVIQLDLIPNFELEAMILGYAHDIEILEPLSLKRAIIDRLQRIQKRNS
jgi:predicted DNA-binding transcriptional regulator YafY